LCKSWHNLTFSLPCSIICIVWKLVIDSAIENSFHWVGV
jgi:hypothetical protein